MRIHLKATEADGTHTRFTVFVDGVNCGELCMLEHEAILFHDIIRHSTWKLDSDEFITSGEWFGPKGLASEQKQANRKGE